MNTPIQMLRDVMAKDLSRLELYEENASKVINEYIDLIDEVWLEVEREYIKNYVKDSTLADSSISSEY